MCALPMLRRLLACLALLTGLAAAGAPAQAELASSVAAQLETSAMAPVAERGAVAAVLRPLPRRFEPARGPSPATRLVPAADRLSVRIGSDRARE